MSRSRNSQATSDSQSLAEKNVGLIAQRVLIFWRHLPERARYFYDVEDMISDAVVHVLRKSAQYDPQRARESTWIQRVTDNFCRDRLQHYTTRQYTHCATVDMTPAVENHIQTKDFNALRNAREAVERVIEYSSDPVLDFLELLFEGIVVRKPSRIIQEELKTVARKRGATCDDFITVLRNFVK